MKDPNVPVRRDVELAAILAKGVICWRRQVKAADISAAPESSPGRDIGLELPAERPLSVARTRRLTVDVDGDDV